MHYSTNSVLRTLAYHTHNLGAGLVAAAALRDGFLLLGEEQNGIVSGSIDIEIVRQVYTAQFMHRNAENNRQLVKIVERGNVSAFHPMRYRLRRHAKMIGETSFTLFSGEGLFAIYPDIFRQCPLLLMGQPVHVNTSLNELV